MEKANLLSSLYYSDPTKPYSFSSKQKLFKAAAKINPSISMKDVDDFWLTNSTPNRYPQHKQAPARPPFALSGPCDSLGADLADMRRLKRFNRGGWTWFLCLVDLFSREVIGLQPMKNKTAAETARALDRALTLWKKQGNNCNYRLILTDSGSEFLGACKDVYQRWNLIHINTLDSDVKVSQAEKLLSEVKKRLWKQMSYAGNWEWVDLLPYAEEAINHSFNRNLGSRSR